jgi:ribosomal protein S18 acetylase RimI-like enzyme
MNSHCVGVFERGDLCIAPARSEDLARYIDMMEEIAGWLQSRGITQWRAGSFRLSLDYYADSIERQEVQLAYIGHDLIGTVRLLLQEPIVWPEMAGNDGVYVHSLAVRREWAGQGLGLRMLEWAGNRAALIERSYVRLDCMADNEFLRRYYEQAGFEGRGEIKARYPEPVGTLRLRRYEKRVGVE